MKSIHDKIWPYLHGELSEQEKKAFEQALDTDELLFQALEERKKSHAHLREAPEEEDNEELIDALLERWEAEHPEYQEKPTFSRGNIIKMSIPLATAAAAAFVLVSAPWRSETIRWQKTHFGTQPQFRDGALGASLYSGSDLKQIDKLIRRELENELLFLKYDGMKWRLQLQIQETAGGNILVEISGHPEQNSEISKIWKNDFQSLEKLKIEAPAWTEHIAAELTDLRTP